MESNAITARPVLPERPPGVKSALTYYEGEQGVRYFARQNRGGLDQGRLEAWKFAPYVRPTDTVADFGCGSGALLASLDCAHRVGIEVNPAACAEAARHNIEIHHDPRSAGAARAHVVISNHALEHVPSPFEALAALREILMPGGRLVVCVPIDDWRTQRTFRPDDPDHHLYAWTPQLLGNLLAAAGFRVDSIRIVSRCFPPGWRRLFGRVPGPVFELLSFLSSVLLRRRQLLAVATKA